MRPRLLDRFESRVRLEGVLSARTGLHIGAGASRDPLGTDAPVVRTIDGQPYIPGSSLKGVIRSAAESLLRGLDGSSALRSCDQVAGDGCLDHKTVEVLRKEHTTRTTDPETGRTVAAVDERAVAEEVWKRSCTICRLFGSMALASRVRFPDLPLLGEPVHTEIRNGVGIDRDKELAASGVLYDFEAVPPETSFRLTVITDNTEDWEVGLLLYLFEELDNGSLAIGGKTSRGLGQVRIGWQRIIETTITKGSPFAHLLSSRDLLESQEQPAEEPAAAVEEAPPIPDSGDSQAWQTLVEILRGMPEINKGELGKLGAEKGLTKASLNDKLGLGLDPKHTRKSWDTALERLVECGFLDRHDDTYRLAGREPDGEEAAVDQLPVEETRDPALQAAYDRFIGAMSRLWEEEVC